MISRMQITVLCTEKEENTDETLCGTKRKGTGTAGD